MTANTQLTDFRTSDAEVTALFHRLAQIHQEMAMLQRRQEMLRIAENYVDSGMYTEACEVYEGLLAEASRNGDSETVDSLNDMLGTVEYMKTFH